jgi:AcrR family transcriptional regulator
LATALGIQSPTLYHHIATKEDLLYRLCIDVLTSQAQVVFTRVAVARTPRKRLEALIRTHISAALANLDWYVAMLLELRELSLERRNEVIHLRDAYEAFVRRTIREAQDAGVVRRDLSAKYLGLAMLNLLNWSFVWYKPGGDLSIDDLGELLSVVYLDGVAIAGRPRSRREAGRRLSRAKSKMARVGND